jgi:molecular chaperone DnaJ
MTLKLQKKGNFLGDLIIKVQVRKSAAFGREGHNAVSELQISVLDAVLGGEKEVSTIEGTKKKIKIPQGLQDGDKITLKNEGFYLVNSNNKGDYIITVKIIIPKSLTA